MNSMDFFNWMLQSSSSNIWVFIIIVMTFIVIILSNLVIWSLIVNQRWPDIDCIVIWILVSIGLICNVYSLAICIWKSLVTILHISIPSSVTLSLTTSSTTSLTIIWSLNSLSQDRWVNAWRRNIITSILQTQNCTLLC